MEDCRKYAEGKGWSVFAVQYQTECYTAENAGETYQKYGEGSGCANGKGGDWRQDVYEIQCKAGSKKLTDK